MLFTVLVLDARLKHMLPLWRMYVQYAQHVCLMTVTLDMKTLRKQLVMRCKGGFRGILTKNAKVWLLVFDDARGARGNTKSAVQGRIQAAIGEVDGCCVNEGR